MVRNILGELDFWFFEEFLLLGFVGPVFSEKGVEGYH